MLQTKANQQNFGIKFKFTKKKSDLVETMILWIKNLLMNYQNQEDQIG